MDRVSEVGAPAHVARARVAAAAIAPLAARIEAERRMPPEAVAALVDAGVYKLFVPRAYGGADASPRAMVEMIEILARADGSAGWCTMIGATSSLMSVYLDDAAAREVFGAPDAVTCGVFAPMGRAVPVDGGYRVSGRWPFASGCQHSQWRMGGTLVEGAAPLPGGGPDVLCAILRADETHVHDTWDTSGLRGTGSHDIEARDVFVPRARTFSLLTDEPRHPCAVPFFGVLAAGVAAVGLGIARAAIDAFVELAAGKRLPSGKRTLAHKELAQVDAARAEARVSAARAFLYEALDAAIAAPRGDVPARARLRLAACHAADEAAAATALVYNAGGGAAIYAASPLQRCFRDAHVVTHHIMVGSTALTLAGRLMLGVESELATL